MCKNSKTVQFLFFPPQSIPLHIFNLKLTSELNTHNRRMRFHLTGL